MSDARARNRIADRLVAAGVRPRHLPPPAVDGRTRIAYHEAGHVVIAAVHGLPVDSVTITPARAETLVYSVPLTTPRQLVRHVRAQVALGWAGVCAELLLTGERQPRLAWAASERDLERALAWATVLYTGIASADRFVDSTQPRVRRMLAARWPHVQRIARALMRHEQLHGAQLARLTAYITPKDPHR